MAAPESRPLTKQTLAGFKWSTLSIVLQAVLQFGIFSTLAHLLTPREFGIVAMATIFTNFIERVGFLGVGQALVQRETLTEAHIRCGFVLCLVLGTLLFAMFYFTSPAIAEFFEEGQLVPVLRIISLSFLFAAVAEVPLSLLQRGLRFKKLMVITNTSYLIGNGAVGIVMALLGYSYWALVAAIVVARGMRVVLGLQAYPQRVSFDFSRQDCKDLLQIGVGFSLGRLSNYCALVGDNFVTGKLLGAQALGLYGRAYQLMTGPATYVGQVLEKVLFAALSQRQNEPAKISKYFLYGVELCSLASIGGAVVMIVAAEELVTFLFGAHWLEAVPAVKILAFGVFFRTCYKNSDTVIRALGAVYRLAYRQALYAAVVVFGAILGSRWGIEGVSVAVLFAVFLNYSLLSYLCLRLLGTSWRLFVRAHYPALWIGLWQFISLKLTILACRDAGLNSFFSLAIGGILMGTVSVLALFICPPAAVPTVFVWLGRNLGLERYGKPGRFARDRLLRGAAPKEECPEPETEASRALLKQGRL